MMVKPSTELSCGSGSTVKLKELVLNATLEYDENRSSRSVDGCLQRYLVLTVR